MYRYIYLIIFLSWYNDAKVLIMTSAYNRPDFIEIQHKTFKKFLKEEYEFIVFNDAQDPAKELAIKNMCEHLGIMCVRVPETVHNIDPLAYHAWASFRHGEVVQYAFDNYRFKHNDIVFLIDADVFLIREFSVRKFLQNCDLYIMGTHNDNVMLQLFFVNMAQIKDPYSMNFRAKIKDTILYDTGQQMKYYIQNHPELKLKKGMYLYGLHALNLVGVNIYGDLVNQLKNADYSKAEIALITSIMDVWKRYGEQVRDCNMGFFEKNIFLDYQHGSSWHEPNQIIFELKETIFRNFINAIINKD